MNDEQKLQDWTDGLNRAVALMGESAKPLTFPDGFTARHTGQTFRIKVDRNELDEEDGKPFLLYGPNGLIGDFKKLAIEGGSELKAGKMDFNDGCGKVTSAWIETTAPVIVG